jgi:hypothetical protein
VLSDDLLSDVGARAWRAYTGVDFDRGDRGLVHVFSVFCPDCAAREFG